MLYRISCTEGLFNHELLIISEPELLFIYELAAISENTRVLIENISDEALASLFKNIGVQSDATEKNLLLSKNNAPVPEIVIKDFSRHTDTVIPFAIACAANRIPADLKGLELLSKNEPRLISLLQRELYRFNINTDFCDYSKLKIYSNKNMERKIKPVDVSENDFLSLCFIPMAAKFGSIEIELSENFFKKYDWLSDLLNQLKFEIEKI